MHLVRKQGARVRRVAAAAVTLATLLAASAPSALAQHTSRTLSTPTSGGTINYRDINVPTCIDPLVAPTSAEGLADFPTFDNLVLLDGAGHARPDLLRYRAVPVRVIPEDAARMIPRHGDLVALGRPRGDRQEHVVGVPGGGHVQPMGVQVGIYPRPVFQRQLHPVTGVNRRFNTPRR